MTRPLPEKAGNMIDLENMNHAQRRAVTWTGGPLLVLAGPGSGKTFTITNRILFLMEQGTPPEQILVITFTREAAMSMQRRFRELSGGFRPVCFGTFHSVFYQILKNSGVLNNHKILNGSERKKILLPILKRFCTDSEKRTGEALGEDAMMLLSAFSYYKNTLRMEEAAEMAPEEWRPQFGTILQRYEKAARDDGGLDFDDMLCRCRELLAGNEKLLRSWQARFRHILIDEFQDINPVQYEVVKLLSGGCGNVFAVGDDDQAIYGFRGSEPECLRRFEREYGAEKVLLDINYRSHPQIVRASLAVVAGNGDRFSKQLRPSPEREAEEKKEQGKGRKGTALAHEESGNRDDSGEGDKKRVKLAAFSEKGEQYDYLAERLRRFLAVGKDGEKCAVLFRTNARMQELAVRLRTEGIPFVIKEKVPNVYEHFIVRDIMAYLLLASGQWDRGLLLRVVNRPSRYVSREAIGSSGGSLKELISFYETWGRTDTGARAAAEKLRGFDRQLKALGKLPPGLAVSYIRRAVGYEAYLRQTAGNALRFAEWLEVLEWLREDAGRFPDIEKWQEAQEAYGRELKQNGDAKRAEGAERNGSAGGAEVAGRSGGAGGTKSAERSSGAGGTESAGRYVGTGEPGSAAAGISLMTVHGSKGLEFDTVIVADCNESVFPHGSLQTKEQVEEERRIFYVAMTRAKENLELLYLTGTKERPRLPSRFLNPLLKEI